MKIFNSMSGRNENFLPLKPGYVGMYVCGITVYDNPHIGNARSAIAFDLIRKYLIYLGYNVKFVRNITDIDDKIINRAREMKIESSELAERVTKSFKAEFREIGIMESDLEPLATGHIAEMIELIAAIEKKGAAYVLEDGVYYDITAFPEYGKLSKQKIDNLQSGARVTVNKSKRNPQDFVMWKFSRQGEPAWPSPWGNGRPGWHIECSAMSSKYLGNSFDIHGGGCDLMFPHHECEIAQSELVSGMPLAKYWLHNGFVQVNNEKMSKSLGNFWTVRDLLAKFPGQVIRYLCVASHYRAPIEFNFEVLEQSRNSLERIHDFSSRLLSYEQNGASLFDLEAADQTFRKIMDHDFDTPNALAFLFEIIRDINKMMDTGKLSISTKNDLITWLKKIDSIFGIFWKTDIDTVSPEISRLISAREEARGKKDFKQADEIRDKLIGMGVKLEDGPNGTTRWKRI